MPTQGAGGKIHLGLEVQSQFLPIERTPELHFDVELWLQPIQHLRREEARAATTGDLGATQRRLRAAKDEVQGFEPSTGYTAIPK